MNPEFKQSRSAQCEDRHQGSSSTVYRFDTRVARHSPCSPHETESTDINAIKVERLTKFFGAVMAVDDVSFEVKRGHTCALLGGNGAGKSTIIAMLLGLLTPSRGAVRILGVDLLSDRYRVLPRLNFSSPYVDLPKRLTVEQNLRVYGKLYGVRNLTTRLRILTKDLQLEALLKHTFGTLSAGQKTRVSLAKALINHPELLLLDEPTASLDPDTADRIRGYLERYRDNNHATILSVLQPVALALPASHVFEGMRAVMFEGTFSFKSLFNAVSLNLTYLAVAVLVFARAFNTARRQGLLLNIGE